MKMSLEVNGFQVHKSKMLMYSGFILLANPFLDKILCMLTKQSATSYQPSNRPINDRVERRVYEMKFKWKENVCSRMTDCLFIMEWRPKYSFIHWSSETVYTYGHFIYSSIIHLSPEFTIWNDKQITISSIFFSSSKVKSSLKCDDKSNIHCNPLYIVISACSACDK